jgi:hypothetical protein
MTTDLTQALADCLEAIEQTGATLEDCLTRHPEQQAALSELLPVAALLRSAPAIVPSLDFRANARAHLIARLPARRTRLQTFSDGLRSTPRSLASGAARRPALARVLIGLLIMILAGTGVAYASAESLPNDPLYSVKLTVEQIRLVLAPDIFSYTALRLAFANERLQEIDRLIAVGRELETVVALNDFDQQVRTAISRVQSVDDAAERRLLIAELTEAIDRYDQRLADVETRLPAAAQPALRQTRDKIRAALHEPAPSLPPTMAPVARPTSSATGSPTLRPTRSPTAPAAHPTLITTRRPTSMPANVPTWVTPDATYLATYAPTQWGTLNPTLVATLVPTKWRTLIPTAWPTIVPTRWRTLIPSVWPTAFPTIQLPPILPPDLPPPPIELPEWPAFPSEGWSPPNDTDRGPFAWP